MTVCYLALGSNLRSPERQLRQAFQHLRKLPKSAVLDISRLYPNQAMGRRAQPPYCNCVLKLKTSFSPQQLLQRCLDIEKKQQRVRKVRYGARTLDIDVLLYGKQTIRTKKLTVPHPRMFERDFVLIPLSDIDPQNQAIQLR
jgi:2-amino-4-hydroxy-6-hydroxymethyldihydropteridine diphosphokinase